MLLRLDSHPKESVAAIDSFGKKVKYGDLCTFSLELKKCLPERSFLFLLVQNDVGGIAWSIACLASGNVPLILNAHTEEGLYNNLYDLYRPSYICVPKGSSESFGFKKVAEFYDYVLLHTGELPVSMYHELSHLLPTSGSTGSPKLVRHKYENIEAAALNISTFFELKPVDRPLLVLPLY